MHRSQLRAAPTEAAKRALRGLAPFSLGLTLLAAAFVPGAQAETPPAAAHFREKIQPLLSKYCYDCHADGANKGGVSFDELKSDADLLNHHDLWLAVLKNTRAGLMPPAKKPQPEAAELGQLADWIKFEAFGLDPVSPDPGRVTVRRLNRTEYHNTIRDLMGVDFNTQEEFPPDDTGHGFDDIGDVLNLSPMLLEKYLNAARTIVNRAVPTQPLVPAEQTILGREFHHEIKSPIATGTNQILSGPMGNGLALSYYQDASATHTFKAETAGRYALLVDLTSNEKFVDNRFDTNKCQLVFTADGQELLTREFVREGGKAFHYQFTNDWSAGTHTLSFSVHPLTPEGRQIRSLTLRVDSVTVQGPLDPKHWVPPHNYSRFFPRKSPLDLAQRQAYAGELLEAFATKAFRRPVDADYVARLVHLAEDVYALPGSTFESGIAHAMVAVLASPRFIYREESSEDQKVTKGAAPVDEYSLASRLSYFFWSSMPDEELFKLAKTGQLRQQLDRQVKRLLADPRSDALVQNFSGQWLQTRDIDTVEIEARAVLARENASSSTNRNRGGGFGFGKPRAELDGDLRKAMRQETQLYFANIVREDRDVTELLDSNYTFLNERLAKHYGLTNLDLTGSEMRKVELPAGSPRGGILTQGTILAVTSNPTRTSPVKRGLFILDNILGTPPPGAPPNIPPLEDTEKVFKDHQPTLREVLQVHREKAICASCHNRMDPLGLALENFNALGMWRESERGQVIDSSGQLISGESFANLRELKQVLATKHRLDFYRTLTEKLLTYALGRGLEYYDVQTVDKIVADLDKSHGHFSTLLKGIIDSSPFQKRREGSGYAVDYDRSTVPGMASAATATAGQNRVHVRHNTP